MTKPFPFATLELEHINPIGMPDEHESSMVTKESDVRFPPFSFDSSSSTEHETVEPTFNEQELAAAIEEARRTTALEVEAETRAAVSNELDHRQVEALEAIRNQLGASEETLASWMSETISMAQQLAVMLGNAVVPKALELQPLADIASMVEQSLLQLVEQPSIELRLEPELVERSSEILQEIIEETGFRGKLETIAAPTLSSGSAQLVWKGGMADRDLDRIRKEVSAITEAWFVQQTPDPSPNQLAARATAAKDPVDTEVNLLETEHQSSSATERSTS